MQGILLTEVRIMGNVIPTEVTSKVSIHHRPLSFPTNKAMAAFAEAMGCDVDDVKACMTRGGMVGQVTLAIDNLTLPAASLEQAVRAADAYITKGFASDDVTPTAAGEVIDLCFRKVPKKTAALAGHYLLPDGRETVVTVADGTGASKGHQFLNVSVGGAKAVPFLSADGTTNMVDRRKAMLAVLRGEATKVAKPDTKVAKTAIAKAAFEAATANWED
jgi:hypothetical protein